MSQKDEQLLSAKEDYHQSKDDLDAFKRRHQIKRLPDYPDSAWETYGWLLLALLIESILNGVFFAEEVISV
ncbi:MAG: hypothetical protein Q9M91_06850 [Candidatus Dojkabacteria bacterium]|nr:hypothetical protein [Candidatus Dojkabacteria bacterium]